MGGREIWTDLGPGNAVFALRPQQPCRPRINLQFSPRISTILHCYSRSIAFSITDNGDTKICKVKFLRNSLALRSKTCQTSSLSSKEITNSIMHSVALQNSLNIRGNNFKSVCVVLLIVIPTTNLASSNLRLQFHFKE